MKAVVEHLSNLIRIPTPSSVSNRPVVEYAVEVLSQAGWTWRELGYLDSVGVEKVNLVAWPPGQDNKGPVELAFVCHTDTVPYAADWAEALAPVATDGLVRGCGSCDVKGFLACLLAAIEESESSAFVDGLRLILTADEEVGCVGAARLLASERIRPKRVVIGEPTSLHPARAGKGYCLAEVTVFGEEAHSAHPEKGRSAIYRAARLITAIEEYSSELAQERNPFFTPGFTSVNVGTIHGGTAKNIVAGRCLFQLEWRPIPGQDVEAVPSAVLRIADTLRDDDPSFRCEVRVVRRQPGFESGADSLLVRSIEKLTGRTAVSIPFGSEANLFGSVAEEVVVFGPGDMATAHSRRECVPLKELDEAVRCLLALMTSRPSKVVTF
ncbi:MAG TPA: acetylornithine deacetylase [Edaphobacter sp.]|jgi:acetylornithine deacetylase|nr:acetylornithine deacetylase [Edaphobacter sp.]